MFCGKRHALRRFFWWRCRLGCDWLHLSNYIYLCFIKAFDNEEKKESEGFCIFLSFIKNNKLIFFSRAQYLCTIPNNRRPNRMKIQ